jgi:hypothetical protein
MRSDFITLLTCFSIFFLVEFSVAVSNGKATLPVARVRNGGYPQPALCFVVTFLAACSLLT